MASRVVDRVWARIHKWLALLMAIQILFWFVSGLFFAAVPIETVRSEHKVASTAAPDIAFGVAADGLLRLGSAGETAQKIEIRHILGRPVALLQKEEGRPLLFDLRTGEPIGPIPMSLAVRIAEADHLGNARAVAVERVTEASPEYRGLLPAWRVDFEDGTRRSLYVAADTGLVTARRSTLWRVYDFLWGLHIMDYRGHQDFNSLLLVVATLLALVVAVTGILMLPSRLGFTNWRRRRALSAERTRFGARRE